MDDAAVPVSGSSAEPEDMPDMADIEFAMVYQAEKPLLVRYLMQAGAAFHDADEAAQLALAALYDQWGTVRSPHSWLRKVAWRKLARVRTAELPLEGHDRQSTLQDPAAIESLQEDAVISAILRLPPLQGRVFALFFDQFKTNEIAEILQISPDAVRQHLARARARLRLLPEFAEHGYSSARGDSEADIGRGT